VCAYPSMTGMLPSDMIISIGRFLRHIDRIGLYSAFHPDPYVKSTVGNAIMIGDILDYYDNHHPIRDDEEAGFLSEYIEWIVFHGGGSEPVSISDICSKKYRNVERHFTEIWKLYGGTLHFGGHDLVVSPPERFSRNCIGWFLSKWFDDDDVEVLNYGYGDYGNY